MEIDIPVVPIKEKRFRISAKHFILTYPRCYVEKELMLIALKLKVEDLSYALIAQEAHKDGTPHIHILCSSKKKLEVHRPNFFDMHDHHGNYQSAKSTDKVKEYITKYDTNPLVFGEYESNGNSAVQKRLTMNLKIIEKPLPELIQDGSISMMNYAKIKQAKAQYMLDTLEVPSYLPRECIWIYGPSRIGKSRYARDTFGASLFAKPLNKWWDGYTNEETVLIDDFDSHGTCLGHYLKIWADCYSFVAETKGGTIRPVYKRLIITSNYTIRKVFSIKDKMIEDEWDTEISKAIEARFKVATIEDGFTLVYL